MTSVCRDTRPDVSSKIKRVGPFLLGPNLGNPPPVQCMKQYLARRERTREYYTIKVLTLPERDSTEPEPLQEQQGKILIHTEHKLLSRLKGDSGVIQHRGFFKEIKDEPLEVDGKVALRKVTKLCLLLDAAATPHDFNADVLGPTRLTNLQYYVLKNKKLPESEAISIFVNIVQIVERLHKENIVHRDLKLGNFTFNIETKEVILGNFGLGKELEKEDQLLRDQRGSPAYISPEVISGKAYLGKPSDMWALGVTLYTMLFGQFPFYEKEPPELFRKIKAAEYKIPGDAVIGSTSVNLIQSLLVLDPLKRLTASELLRKLKTYVQMRYSRPADPSEDHQVVPSFSRKRSHDASSEEPSDASRSTREEPSLKRSRGHEGQNMFDLEEILVATASQLEREEGDNAALEASSEAESGFQEAPQMRQRYAFGATSGLRSIKISKVKEEARVLTQGDLEKLYAIYVANKTKGRGGAAVAGAGQALPQVTTSDESSDGEGGGAATAEGRLSDGDSNLRNGAAVESRPLLQSVSDESIAAASRVRQVVVSKRLRQQQRPRSTPELSPSVPSN